MKILIVDDSDEKVSAIRQVLSEVFTKDDLFLSVANVFSQAAVQLTEEQFDLVIIDLLLPLTSGGAPTPIGHELVGVLKQGHVNRKCQIVALTAYPELASEQQVNFENSGIVVLSYELGRKQWQEALTAIADRVRAGRQLDFLIVSALEEEREAYAQTDATNRRRDSALNLDIEFMKIDSFNGACVLLPGMGLVMASVVTSRAIEVFQPKLVAMSGICAGFKSDITLGQILIGNPCWEYQSGKWSDSGFQIEPYQVTLNEKTRIVLKTICDQENLLKKLEQNFMGNRPSKPVKPAIVPFASGSAVLARSDKLDQIKNQHRKVAGLDMELFGVYKAVQLSSGVQPDFFGAKTVVDLGNQKKDDFLHEYGCLVSARMTALAIPTLLKSN